MTRADVKERVDALFAKFDSDGDDERAHGEEDAAYEWVLMAIAVGECESPFDCAIEVLRLSQGKWARRCA